MSNTIRYTVKQDDGFLTIARFVFSNSSRIYIQGLVKRHDIMLEVAEKIKHDLYQGHQNFTLKTSMTIELHADPGYYIARLKTQSKELTPKAHAVTNSTKAITSNENQYFVIHNTDANLSDEQIERMVKKKKQVQHMHASRKEICAASSFTLNLFTAEKQNQRMNNILH